MQFSSIFLFFAASVLTSGVTHALGICGPDTESIIAKAQRLTVEVEVCSKFEAGIDLEQLRDRTDNEIIDVYRSILPKRLSAKVKADATKHFIDYELVPARRAARENPGEKLPVLARQPCITAGSGFVFAENFIMTNSHVVNNGEIGAAYIYVGKGRSRRKIPVNLRSYSEAKDLAMLEIDEKYRGKTALGAPVSIADEVRVGDVAFALGQPAKLQQTLAYVVVSRVDRVNDNMHYVQVNGDIFQGSSGGPTFNCDGELVGVNTAVVSPHGKMIGVGYAIPANTAQRIGQRLLRQSGGLSVRPADIRVGTRSLPTSDSAPSAALVTTVYERTFAENIGLREDDLILDVILENSVVEIAGSEDPSGYLQSLLREVEVGEKLGFVVQRGDEEVELGPAISSPVRGPF